MRNVCIGMISGIALMLLLGWSANVKTLVIEPDVRYEKTVDENTIVNMGMDMDNGSYVFYVSNGKEEDRLKLILDEDLILVSVWADMGNEPVPGEMNLRIHRGVFDKFIVHKKMDNGIISYMDKDGDLLPEMRFQSFSKGGSKSDRLMIIDEPISK